MISPRLCASHYAWLAVYYSELRGTGSFEDLSPELRLEALSAAVGRDYPAKSMEIQEWNASTRAAMLGVLEDLTDKERIAREVVLWEVSRNGERLRCFAVYLPQGIDVRLMRNDETLRTLLAGEQKLTMQESDRWRAELAASGWVVD